MRVRNLLISLFLLCMLPVPSLAGINSVLRLDRETAETEVGKFFSVSAILPGAGSLWWTSNDLSIADIVASSDNKLVTVRAWKTGIAEISAHFSPAGSEVVQSASCRVTVVPNSNPERVAAVRITPEVTAIEKGKSTYLRATVVPETAIDKNLRWETSDSRIATVSQQGLVRGIAPGYAVIRVVTDDGGFSAECSVEVVDNEVRVNGISLNHTSTYVYTNGTRQLLAYVSPENATNKRVRWVSSNWNYASVSQAGVVVGNRSGKTVVISAITEDGGYVAECIVKVRDDWFDFGEGCSVQSSSPLALLLLLPLLSLFLRRK